VDLNVILSEGFYHGSLALKLELTSIVRFLIRVRERGKTKPKKITSSLSEVDYPREMEKIRVANPGEEKIDPCQRRHCTGEANCPASDVACVDF